MAKEEKKPETDDSSLQTFEKGGIVHNEPTKVTKPETDDSSEQFKSDENSKDKDQKEHK